MQQLAKEHNAKEEMAYQSSDKRKEDITQSYRRKKRQIYDDMADHEAITVIIRTRNVRTLPSEIQKTSFQRVKPGKTGSKVLKENFDILKLMLY